MRTARTMKGICSAHPSLGGGSEDRSQAQDQAIGQGRLHSVLVTAHTGEKHWRRLTWHWYHLPRLRIS